MNAINEVSIARLRLAQVALVSAMDSNRELLTDQSWQDGLSHVTRLISEASRQAEEPNQLVLFPAGAKRRVG